MYDSISAKSKRFGFCAFTLCFIIALSICSSFRPPLHPSSLVNLQLNAVEDMLIADETTDDSYKTEIPSLVDDVEDMLIADDTSDNSDKTVGSSTTLQTLTNTSLLSLHAAIPQNLKRETENKKRVEQLCRVLKADADYYEIEGDIRVNSISSTVFLIRPPSTICPSNITSWTIQPYPRRGITHVKNWTVTLAAQDDENIPECSKNHTLPAVLFSIGGYTGNHFHDFSDLIIPLYSTTSQFKREVHFLASDYKPWWPSKFHGILNMLTKHGIVDIDRENYVNCYSKLIAGLQFHKELIINPAFTNPTSRVSMLEFRQLLRQTYSLERTNAIIPEKGNPIRPRLVIISRKRTRIITNEDQICRAARKQGYEVVLAEGDVSTNLTKFAQLVNSCDVMMGIHGAGLTNMIFLPDNAVLIQVVPLGAIDGFAKLDFGNPAPGMKISYLEYKIGMRESSLVQEYSVDDPILRDPLSFHRKGWDQLRAVYLDNQNVTIDIRRFKGTLAKALKLLRRH